LRARLPLSIRRFAAAAILGCAALGAGAAPFDPRKVVFINETADHRYDRALRASTRWIQESTGIQVAIVLEKQLLALTTIEQQASDLFKKLGLGRASDGKALLFLMSEKERVFKIEVSYDLEAVFPDAICKRLEEGARTFMLSASPYARRDFLVELNVTMKLHYLQYMRDGTLSDVMLPSVGPGRLSEYLSGGAGIVGRGYAATIEQVQRELKPLPASLETTVQPGSTPEETVERYLSSLEYGIGAPNLPLLTEASRYFRVEKPHAPGYLRRQHAYYVKARPYRIVRQDNLAAAMFPPKSPVLPIFLRRDARGLWLVDEPKVEATLHLYQDGTSQLKYRKAPYAFAATDYQPRTLFEEYASPPPLLPLATDLKQRVRELEAKILARPDDTSAYVALADVLHFELYWLPATEALYEKILRMDPNRTDIRWRLVDVYQMTSDIDGHNRQLCELLERAPRDAFVQWHYGWFRKSFYPDEPLADRCPEVLRWPQR
jgi:hypothetical protein